MLLTATTWGATLTVGASGDHQSLASAVAAASSGDTLVLAAETFDEQVTVTKSLTLTGQGASTVLDGTGLGGRLLSLQGVHVTLESMTLSGGDDVDGGAIYVDGGSLTTSEVVFDENSATSGGAIYGAGADLVLLDTDFSENAATDGGAVVVTSGSLQVTGGSWSDNDAYEDGGAVWATTSTLDFDSVELTGNQAAAGYGGAIYLDGSGSAASFTSSTLSENVAYRYGGAVYAVNLYGAVTFEGCTLADNEGTYGHGGAVYVYNRSDLVARDTTFEDNTAYYAGGGVYQYYLSSAELTDCTFDGNESLTYPGGGFYTIVYTTESDPTVVTRTSFVANEAVHEGGGLFAYYPYQLLVTDSLFQSNRAGDESAGGGLYSEYAYELGLSGTHFVANEARYGGGAYLDKVSGTMPWTVTNTIFQENVAEVGGGMCVSGNENTGAVELVNNAFVGNRADREGAALCVSEARPSVRNTVFAYHPAGSTVAVFDVNSAAYTSFAFDAFWENVDGDWSGETVKAREELLEVAPDFGAYSRDGNPYDDSFVLAPGSALIDAGDPSLSDPDGSRSDIGPMGGPGASVADDDGDGLAAWLDCDDDDPEIGRTCPDEEEEEEPVDTGHTGTDGDTAESPESQEPAEAPDDDEAAGCGCGGAAPSGWLGLVALAGLWRRRTR